MITIILTLLQTIAGIASSKVASGSNVGMLLNLVSDAIKLGDAGYEALVSLNSEVAAMAAAKTDPTQDQWDALKARSDAAHAAIQNS